MKCLCILSITPSNDIYHMAKNKKSQTKRGKVKKEQISFYYTQFSNNCESSYRNGYGVMGIDIGHVYQYDGEYNTKCFEYLSTIQSKCECGRSFPFFLAVDWYWFNFWKSVVGVQSARVNINLARHLVIRFASTIPSQQVLFANSIRMDEYGALSMVILYRSIEHFQSLSLR